MTAAPQPGGTPAAIADTEYARAARALAGRLARLAVTDAHGAPTWSGDDVDPTSPYTVSLVHGTLDDGLLTGRTGIALALSACSLLPEGPADWGRLAVRAATAGVAATRRALTTRAPSTAGWQSGALGVAHAARTIGLQQDAEHLEDAAATLAVEALHALWADPDVVPPYPDLLDGTAGHLLAALALPLPEHAHDLRAAVAARLAADLAAAAVHGPYGASWPMAGQDRSVCGLAHGGSGAALALTEAAAAGVPGDWEGLAQEAVAWEAAHHDTARPGWPDLRVPRHPPAVAWCHGALGIGVAAARRHRLTGDPDAAVAHQRAVRAARVHDGDRHGPFDASLCHGVSGAIELHLVSAEQLATPTDPPGPTTEPPASPTGAPTTPTGATAAGVDLAAHEHLHQARVLARRITRAGLSGAPLWTCGLPEGGLTPCVLTGVAGIATTLARCHDPHLLPSLALPGPAIRR